MEPDVPWVSKARVDWAGTILTDAQPSEGDRQEALRVWNAWRAAHAPPLDHVTKDLRGRSAALDETATVFQRLKRLPSVQAKLRRMGTTKLSQLQDIGGCRSVLETVRDVKAFLGEYESAFPPPDTYKIFDYVRQPKVDGYRSVHIVRRHMGDDLPASGLLVEVQVRSRSQHAWATAVETVDTMQRQTIKAGGGTDDWRRFFQLMSSVIALDEGEMPVPKTPLAAELIHEELQILEERLGAEQKLAGYKAAVKVARENVTGAKYLLVELSPEDQYVYIKGYREEEFEEASRHYIGVEKGKPNRADDTVLVSVQSLEDLYIAYPNYFLDSERFLTTLRRAIH